MRRIYTLVEQLDVASEQLDIGSPVAARLALILCDNVVEIILYTTCTTEIRVDESRDRFGVSKYDNALRQSVLGQRFDPKAKFCRDLGLYAEEELRTTLTAHAYRNELYHSGIKYDPIILPLATMYHEIACDLLPKMRTDVWELVAPESPRVQRHFSANNGFDASDSILKAAESLAQARPHLNTPFQQLLSDFAQEMVAKIKQNLDFLVADNFEGWNEEKILEHVQFHHYAFNDGKEPRIDTSDIASVAELNMLMETLKKDWRPRYTTAPTERWHARASQIEREPNRHKSLQQFQQLRREMGYLAHLLDEAAFGLDAAIQHQVDLRLGK